MKIVRMTIEYGIDDDIINFEDEAYRLFEEEFGTKILDTDSLSSIEIIDESKKESITREEFINFFRQDDFHEKVTTDDCNELFLKVLPGKSDITYQLIRKLFDNYQVEGMTISTIYKWEDDKDVQKTFKKFQYYKSWDDEIEIGELLSIKYDTIKTTIYSKINEDIEISTTNKNIDFLLEMEEDNYYIPISKDEFYGILSKEFNIVR